MTASPNAYRTPYVSQMLKEPDRTWDDCCASVTIMLGNDWTLGEWSIRPDGKPRDVLFLRNLIRKRIGDTDGGLTLHDANDMLHELDPDLPDLPRYPGQAAKPGQSTAGATLRLDRGELKRLLQTGHSAAVCGLSGTVGHVVYFTDGNDRGPVKKDPLTTHGPGWDGERVTWDELWKFTEAKRAGQRAYGSPDAIACAVVKVGEQTEAERAVKATARQLAKAQTKNDGLVIQVGALTEEVKTAKALIDGLTEQVKATAADNLTLTRERDEAREAADTAEAALAACETATPPDCSTAIKAERERVVDAFVAGVDLLAASVR